MEIGQLEIATNNGGLKSGISGLNLRAGLFSEQEPNTAAIVKQDKELRQLKMLGPAEGGMQTMSDVQERDQRNK